MSERLGRPPRTEDCDELVSSEPFLLSDDFGSGGTSNDGARSPFFVVAGVSVFKSPLALGAEATLRKRRAAGPPTDDLGLGGMEGLPPEIPFPYPPDCCCRKEVSTG